MSKIHTAWGIFREDGIVELLDSTSQFFCHKSLGDNSRWKYIDIKSKISSGYTDSPIFDPIEVKPEDVKYVTVPDSNVDKTNDQWDPKFVHNTLSRGMFSNKSVGKLKEGDWDRSDTRVDELPEYKSIKEFIIDDTPLKETPFGERCIDYISAGNERRGHTEPEDYIENREEKIYNLYKSMKDQGYKSQNELNPQRSKYDNFFDEIRVNIGRNGQILFNHTQGHHRLTIAKLLDVDSITVSVIVRHRNWER